MHSRKLVELSALIAVNAPEILSRGHLSASHIEQYWAASKLRLACWAESLQGYLQLQVGSSPLMSQAGPLVVAWREVRPVLEEILVAEILTRVWTCVVCLYDRRHGRGLEALVRRVYAGHLEARNRALNVLVYGRGFSASEAAELNALRRRCERWCDLLLAHLSISHGRQWQSVIDELAIEADRSREFARDLMEDESACALVPLAGQLLQSSLREAFGKGLAEEPPYPAFNQQIADALLACLPDERAAFVPPGDPWLDRIELITSDAEGMIRELLQIEGWQEAVVRQRDQHGA
jgi:hypothetical protein